MYNCEKCGYSTKNKTNYTLHLQTNKHRLAKNIYECQECGLKITTQGGHRRHLKQVHGYDFSKEKTVDKQGEEWKSVENFSKYEISNMARVRIKSTQVEMKQRMKGDYAGINLIDDNKAQKKMHVHKLVALAFVPNDNPKVNTKVDHIDHNKFNNVATNLRWVTQSQNMLHFHQKKRIYKGKEIEQCDNNDNLIKTWENIKVILKENPTWTYSQLSNALHQGGPTNGFYWRYKKEEPIKLELGEKFVNIGIFEDHDFSKYEVSNFGKVRNSTREKLITTIIKGGGYHVLNLYDSINNKPYNIYVHRLVAHKFVKGRTDGNNIVNHINLDKLDNRASNLEWTNIQGNTIHAVGKAVNMLDLNTGEIIKTFDTVSEAYKHFGKKCNSHISRCASGLETQCLGYKWQYV